MPIILLNSVLLSMTDSTATDPNEYEYAFIEPFTSNVVPSIGSNYQFNSFGDHQLRTIPGISISSNQIILTQGGMFKLEASIKPDTTQTGAADYAFHDGSGFTGKMGTIAVDGDDKAIDVHAIAFINTSSGNKSITLKTLAGDSGFNFDANGTAITVQRTAG
jgi:hypothetical protein